MAWPASPGQDCEVLRNSREQRGGKAQAKDISVNGLSMIDIYINFNNCMFNFSWWRISLIESLLKRLLLSHLCLSSASTSCFHLDYGFSWWFLWFGRSTTYKWYLSLAFSSSSARCLNFNWSIYSFYTNHSKEPAKTQSKPKTNSMRWSPSFIEDLAVQYRFPKRGWSFHS